MQDLFLTRTGDSSFPIFSSKLFWNIYNVIFFLQHFSFFLLLTIFSITNPELKFSSPFLRNVERFLKEPLRNLLNTSHVAILDIQTNHFIWFKTPDSSTVLKYIGFPSIFSKVELSQHRLKSFLGQPALQTDHPWDTGGATALIHRTQISHKSWCWAALKS